MRAKSEQVTRRVARVGEPCARGCCFRWENDMRLKPSEQQQKEAVSLRTLLEFIPRTSNKHENEENYVTNKSDGQMPRYDFRDSELPKTNISRRKKTTCNLQYWRFVVGLRRVRGGGMTAITQRHARFGGSRKCVSPSDTHVNFRSGFSTLACSNRDWSRSD